MSEYASLWHTIRHNRAFRLGPFVANILRYVAEISLKPVKGRTSNTIWTEVVTQDINGI